MDVQAIQKILQQQKIGEHIPCGYSTPSTRAKKRSFEEKEKFCISLTEHAPNVINFERKKMLPLTKKELKLHQDATEVTFVEKDSQKILLMLKIIKNLETVIILQVNIEVQHREYVI